MATIQSKYGRRFDEEFKREVAAPARRPGAKREPVARDPGVSAFSVARWKERDGSAPAAAAASAAGVGVAGAGTAPPHPGARERGPARAEDDPKRSRRPLLRAPAVKRGVIKALAGPPPVRKLCRTLGVARNAYYAAHKQAQRPRAPERTCAWENLFDHQFHLALARHACPMNPNSSAAAPPTSARLLSRDSVLRCIRMPSTPTTI